MSQVFLELSRFISMELRLNLLYETSSPALWFHITEHTKDHTRFGCHLWSFNPFGQPNNSPYHTENNYIKRKPKKKGCAFVWQGTFRLIYMIAGRFIFLWLSLSHINIISGVRHPQQWKLNRNEDIQMWGKVCQTQIYVNFHWPFPDKLLWLLD